ncbi:helix-turn-helix transcriptional regulator [Paenibacillus sonchi]|uniref:Helix-turn-helix transcriptional regulator n=1 Tax=Paenibacillus sonchi TaxID=373687 RepID=A0A974P7S7_9BACL|nr:helix-turn-helix transcriptional regulator [Paenibacillus sonchi]
MENDPKVIIAENIKKYLNKNKMSQKTLAEKISLRPSTVSDYLNYRSKPSHGVIQKIADVFGVHKSDIDTTFKYENTQEPLIIKEENEEKKHTMLLM